MQYTIQDLVPVLVLIVLDLLSKRRWFCGNALFEIGLPRIPVVSWDFLRFFRDLAAGTVPHWWGRYRKV